MSEIEYPYLPEGREFLFVPEDHEFMVAARLAQQECAGDPIHPVGAVIVKDGKVVARAGNGFNAGSSEVHVCPRIVQECASGAGYELCELHNNPGHAEPMAVAQAQASGVDTVGADLYMYGHWWCCEPCWKSMIDAGIANVYLPDGAYVSLTREAVTAKTLVPTRSSVYLAGAYTNNGFFDSTDLQAITNQIASACEDLGYFVVVPFRDNPENVHPREERDVNKIFQWSYDKVIECDVLVVDVSSPSLGAGGEIILAHEHDKPIVLISKKGSTVTNFVLGNPSVVYHIEYEDLGVLLRQLGHVLRQL